MYLPSYRRFPPLNIISKCTHVQNAKHLIPRLQTSSRKICTVSHLNIRAVFPAFNYSLLRSSSSYPPHNIIKLPNLSPTMETGTVVSWAKGEGDEVAEGDLLAEIETDKATMSFDSSENGFLAKILAPNGSKDIPVGTALCVLVEESSMVPAFKDYKPDAKVQAVAKAIASSPPISSQKEETPSVSDVPSIVQVGSPTTPPSVAVPGQRVFVSPLARRIANEKGIDIARLATMRPGTGINGMLRSLDLVGIQGVDFNIQVPIEMGSFTDALVSNVRSVIAARLTESKQQIPHYYLTTDIEIDQIQIMRSVINSNLNKPSSTGQADIPVHKITLNDILVKAISLACIKIPECNASWWGEFIRQYHNVDVSVAVATKSGLITPIIFSAEKKGLLQINQEMRELVSKAKANKLKPHEFQGGTFTISNLGMFGITSFSAIINPPQACILAVGNSRHCLVPVNNNNNKDNGFKNVPMISVTLCCDHRVVDGAVGAAWLKEFKNILENPTLMLV